MKKKCLLGLHTRIKDKRNLVANLSHYFDCKYNPEFTDEDNKNKCNIFNIKNVKTDFITGKSLGGCGDHYIELVGSHSKNLKKKMIGSDSEWNLIPVSGNNSKYKINSFKVPEDKSSSLPEDEKVIYDKLNIWNKYVKRRGARMYHKITDEHLILFREWEREVVKINKMYFDKLCSLDLTRI
jgi:hypothetical protein